MKKLKKLFFVVFLFIIKLLPNSLACSFNNVRQKLMKRKIFFYYDEQEKLFYALDNKLKVYFNEKVRGINTYSYGIDKRAISLAETYSLEKIKFKENDVFIDCGANYGDLYFWSLIKRYKLNYISFEPSPEEFRCININCKNKINNNLALSNKDGTSNFFIKSDTGDSSLIEPAEGFKKIVTVNTITLEKYVKDNHVKKIKFLKIEAEGSEPEVLQGAKNILKKVEYIGVDGGPERGKKMETTIEYATEFLLKNNFSIISEKKTDFYINFLFKNKNFEI